MELDKSLTKGTNQLESGIAKARDKIDSIGEQTKEQYQNWKRVLSGALNDKQLIIALAILFGFYLFFSGFNTVLGGNAREENAITCACPAGHSAYYRTLVIITIVTWVTCFILTLIWDTVKFWRYIIDKRSRHEHQSSCPPGDKKRRASSTLERTISSVEEGAQAARKIPVKSIFTKAMGIVDDTLDMVDEGAKALHKIDSGLKEVTEKPLESLLSKSMEVVDNVVTQRLDENTTPKSKVSEPIKLPTAAKSLMNKATEIVGIAKQDPTLAKVIAPLDEKAQQIKHSSVGSMLTKSAELVEDGMQVINQNPAELMVSKAMDVVDDKAQINSAELITTSKELVDKVKENPTNSLLTESMNMIGDAIANENVEGPNDMQLVAGQNSETMHDATSMATSSMLSAGMGIINTGLQAVKQGPDELTLSKAMKLAVDEAPQSNPAGNVLSSQITCESQTAGQNDSKLVLTDTPKPIRVGKTKIKKSHSKKSLPSARQLTEADTNALSRLKHYEDYLWLQFYKVYSVGATLPGKKDQVLPAFIDIVSSDHKEPDTNEEDEIKPLIEGKHQKAYPETTLVEVHDDVDNDIPAIVVEADISDEIHDTNEDHNCSDVRVPTVVIESEMLEESADTINCYKNYNAEDCDTFELTAAENDNETTYHYTNQDASQLSPAPIHPLSQEKSTLLLSAKCNSTDEEDLLESWMNLKAVGLYNEKHEENMATKVADATCARVSFFLHPLLISARLISQLILVPLLLFQILDTYALVCITEDTYCSSTRNQYRLGLDKAALSFAFYCCLLVSILATAMLRWFPCSKHARKADATCLV